MFHEFGHALHGLFSDVRYPYFAGTSVPRDFVEYPSQVNEMWSIWPEVLSNYARHYQTGEPMPAELVQQMKAAKLFGEGFRTVEYLAADAAGLGLARARGRGGPGHRPRGLRGGGAGAGWPDDGGDPAALPHRLLRAHLRGGYSAGYYAYIWSEVLDADTVEWFKENGGMRRENGDHFRSRAALARRQPRPADRLRQLPRPRARDRAAAGAPGG